MASTSKLKIPLPVNEGDSSKVARYNEAMQDIDALLAGMLELSVAGGADVTLTRIQALNRSWKFFGLLTDDISVSIDLTLGAPRIFSVWNATTGAFTLTVKTTEAGSTGIPVTQDSTVELLQDGTHVRYAGAEV